MASPFTGCNAGRVTAGSWLARRWGQRRHPEVFHCGVRVLSGVVPGETTRWRYHSSGADPLIVTHLGGGAQVSLQHGPTALPLVVAAGTESRPTARRPYEVCFQAGLADSDAMVEISVGQGHLHRFGLSQ